jgi:hypothetical protein
MNRCTGEAFEDTIQLTVVGEKLAGRAAPAFAVPVASKSPAP